MNPPYIQLAGALTGIVGAKDPTILADVGKLTGIYKLGSLACPSRLPSMPWLLSGGLSGATAISTAIGGGAAAASIPTLSVILGGWSFGTAVGAGIGCGLEQMSDEVREPVIIALSVIAPPIAGAWKIGEDIGKMGDRLGWW